MEVIFFYVSSQWETDENKERLARSSWADMKLMIRNMSTYKITLSPKAMEKLACIQNYLPEPIPQKKILTKPCFIVYGLMRLGSIRLPTRIIHKPRAPTRHRTPHGDFGMVFK